MIPVTDEQMDEMVERAGRAFFGERPLNPIRRRHLRQTVEAVLAIVERDHCLERKGHVPKVTLCGATCPETIETKGAVVRCTKKPHHAGDAHLARHDGWDVIW